MRIFWLNALAQTLWLSETSWQYLCPVKCVVEVRFMYVHFALKILPSEWLLVYYQYQPYNNNNNVLLVQLCSAMSWVISHCCLAVILMLMMCLVLWCSPLHAVSFASVTGAAGLLTLAAGVNGLAALLALSNLLMYSALYTPMKRLSTANTSLGAVVGAIPPLIGWAAATGSLHIG